MPVINAWTDHTIQKMSFSQKFSYFVTLSQTSPGFYMAAVQVCEKKEKLHVSSNFCIFASVFYLLGELSAIFIKFEIAVCKLFQFLSV